MPGEANFHEVPSSKKLNDCMKKLAKFHLACRPIDWECQQFETSPSITDRIRALEQFETTAEKLKSSIDSRFGQNFLELAFQLVGLFEILKSRIKQDLITSLNLKFRLQPVIRDVWHDHLLFSEDVLTGIVDFGGMRIDSVSCDLARCLGSLVGDDQELFQNAILSYQSVTELSPNECKLVEVLDRSSVAMSGLNWLQWLFVENREFESIDAIHYRLSELSKRLKNLVNQ